MHANCHCLSCVLTECVRTAAFQSIVSNYTILCEALEKINAECHDEYGRKAGGFLTQLEKFSTFFGIKLSYLIFSGIKQLSLTLQGKDTTVQEAADAAELALRYLKRQREDKLLILSIPRFLSRQKILLIHQLCLGTEILPED